MCKTTKGQKFLIFLKKKKKKIPKSIVRTAKVNARSVESIFDHTPPFDLIP